jgi:hypothetical protein
MDLWVFLFGVVLGGVLGVILMALIVGGRGRMGDDAGK